MATAVQPPIVELMHSSLRVSSQSGSKIQQLAQQCMQILEAADRAPACGGGAVSSDAASATDSNASDLHCGMADEQRRVWQV